MARPRVIDGGGGLEAQIEAAERAVDELRNQPDTSQAHLRLIALATAKVWHLRSANAARQDKADMARKYASSATEQDLLAARLEKESLADRVSEIERRLDATRRRGVELAALDD